MKLLVHAVEDGIDDPVDALDADEAGHRPGAAAHFDKAAVSLW
ncbi:MAG: hypothetical protein P8Z30_10875 [Acidobacteriota bacterium]